MPDMLTASAGHALKVAGGLLPGWARPPFTADGRFSLLEANPLQTAVDRAFGGLADSLGLTAPRAVLDNLRALAEVEIERRLAMAEFLGVLGSAVGDAVQLTVQRLGEVGRNGDTVDSLSDLLRMGTRALGQAMHTAMQSSNGIDATARLVRVATERQLRIEKLVGLAAEAVGLPTRRDLDEAYREIQLLKRELRRLRRSGRLSEPGATATPPSTGTGEQA